MFDKIKDYCKSKICLFKKNNNSLSCNVYNKVDKLVKDDDGVLYIESNEGLTESEFLNILNNELIRK
jgi:hypothetical protein